MSQRRVWSALRYRLNAPRCPGIEISWSTRWVGRLDLAIDYQRGPYRLFGFDDPIDAWRKRRIWRAISVLCKPDHYPGFTCEGTDQHGQIRLKTALDAISRHREMRMFNNSGRLR